MVVPIFKGNRDAMNCGALRGEKFMDAMKIVKRRRLNRSILATVNQLLIVPGKGTKDILFILRRIQDEYFDKKKKLCMCFVDSERAFDRVPRKVLASPTSPTHLPLPFSHVQPSQSPPSK